METIDDALRWADQVWQGNLAHNMTMVERTLVHSLAYELQLFRSESDGIKATLAGATDRINTLMRGLFPMTDPNNQPTTFRVAIDRLETAINLEIQRLRHTDHEIEGMKSQLSAIQSIVGVPLRFEDREEMRGKDYDPEKTVDMVRFRFDQLRCAWLTWKKAVEGLTPSGSEFVNNPEACAAYLRERMNYPKQIIRLREELLTTQLQLAAVMFSVDKWFEPGDPRLLNNEETRACDAREITLQAIERKRNDKM